MKRPELNLDRLLPPPLLSIFSSRKKSVENPPPVIIEVHPEIDQKIAIISELSSKIYSTIRQNGKNPHGGDMWAEVKLSVSGTSYWIQAENVGSLIVNTESDEERHSLRVQTNYPTRQILHSEIWNKTTRKLKKEESIVGPENYTYDGLYEACRLLRKCDSFLVKKFSPIPVESSDIFFRTNLVDAIE